MMDYSELVRGAEQRLQRPFARLEEIALINEKRVLDAFRGEPVSPRHFAPTEGYGYDDLGRDALDRVFARAIETEDALVRPQIANGTHAIFLALSSLPNSPLLSAGSSFILAYSALSFLSSLLSFLISSIFIYYTTKPRP